MMNKMQLIYKTKNKITSAKEIKNIKSIKRRKKIAREKKLGYQKRQMSFRIWRIHSLMIKLRCLKNRKFKDLQVLQSLKYQMYRLQSLKIYNHTKQKLSLWHKILRQPKMQHFLIWKQNMKIYNDHQIFKEIQS